MPIAVTPLKVHAITPEQLAASRRDSDSVTQALETVVCGYRIGQLVGRGGMSVVFRVTHPMLNEPLAMKVIIDPRLQDDLAADAIHAHAKLVARVRNPHVVRTIDSGRLPSGEPFVVMERLDGKDLAEHLRERGPLPIDEILRWAMDACDGLAEAHCAGVVHGDIKPANLVVATDALGTSRLKIIDFAPAVPRANAPGDPLVTCSPGYAAPEQLGSRDDVDGRADVFALGAVLYELVTGKRAFEATTLQERFAVATREPMPMKLTRLDCPAELEPVVRRCLAHEREARYPDVLALRSALAELVDGARLAARAQVAATALAGAHSQPSLLLMRDVRKRSTLGRRVFLGLLGPASAMISMTLVRLMLASPLAHGAQVTPPPRPAAVGARAATTPSGARGSRLP